MRRTLAQRLARMFARMLTWCLALSVVYGAYRVGVWTGATEERQSRPIVCPKVEARWVGTGRRRRLDTLTYLPTLCTEN